MTSPTIPAIVQQDLEGRTVRDIVAYSPAEVNDAWCRKVLLKILKSLELQYAMEMPHRVITLETVVFHANGEPLLISDDIDAAPAPAAQQGDDLTALAHVIHYAITHEVAPAWPLDGRVEGYSAAVVATVNACMDPDPALRPRSVDAVRGLLGMVTPAPLPGVLAVSEVVAPAGLDVDATSVAAARGADRGAEAPHAGMRRSTRWAIAAGGGALALALALVIFPKMRNAGSNAPVVPTPLAGDVARPVLPAPGRAAEVGPATVATPADPAATATAPDLADSPSSGASSAGATRSSGGDDQPDDMPRVAARPATAARTVAATVPPSAPSGNASYQLHIKPWGVVYVDGVERGVSPPVKRLALTPGPHTIRITNPKYRDSILEFESAQTTSNGKIIVDFTDEAQ